MRDRGRPPKITCVCPTYGRYERLRQALTCFLLQDYPYKELLILNDAPVPIVCHFPNVQVVNARRRFPTLGNKRQALLDLAGSKWVAHWDDDDLYLPWHLSMCADKLDNPEVGCVKPKVAWMVTGTKDFRCNGLKSNVFEAMILFDREEAQKLGGYTPRISGQSVRMMQRFGKRFVVFKPLPGPSFVFRWSDGHYHIQGGGNEPRSHDDFAARNQDFGGGEPLIPKRVASFYDVLRSAAPDHLEQPGPFIDALKSWLSRPLA